MFGGLALLALTTLAVGTACDRSPPFPDWTIPLPVGTRIVEHRHVSMDARNERIGLETEWVLGDSPDDAAAAFFGLGGVAVGSDGRVYVLDRGNQRVQVFDRDSRHLRTIGRSGQGPGELVVPRTLAVAGETLAVTDIVTRRWQAWDGSGALVSAVELFERHIDVAGLDDGTFIGAFYDDVESPQNMSLLQISPAGEILERYLDWQPGVLAAPFSVRASPGFAVDRTGLLYVYGGDEYQILALASSGEPIWALRTDWPTPPVSEEIIEGILDEWRGFDPLPASGLQRSEWPAVIPQPAIRSVKVDGHGHIYVFPWIYVDSGVPSPDEFPVDVYRSDGVMLFSGNMTVDPIRWWASWDDDIYVHSVDPGTEEEVVIRHRLVEPFE